MRSRFDGIRYGACFGPRGRPAGIRVTHLDSAGSENLYSTHVVGDGQGLVKVNLSLNPDVADEV